MFVSTACVAWPQTRAAYRHHGIIASMASSNDVNSEHYAINVAFHCYEKQGLFSTDFGLKTEGREWEYETIVKQQQWRRWEGNEATVRGGQLSSARPVDSRPSAHHVVGVDRYQRVAGTRSSQSISRHSLLELFRRFLLSNVKEGGAQAFTWQIRSHFNYKFPLFMTIWSFQGSSF